MAEHYSTYGVADRTTCLGSALAIAAILDILVASPVLDYVQAAISSSQSASSVSASLDDLPSHPSHPVTPNTHILYCTSELILDRKHVVRAV